MPKVEIPSNLVGPLIHETETARLGCAQYPCSKLSKTSPRRIPMIERRESVSHTTGLDQKQKAAAARQAGEAEEMALLSSCGLGHYPQHRT